MHKNPAFSKALSSLTHPASLAAMAAILLNDHFIRRAYPSWLTGKISDFAWLLFFPFVLAALLALILPRRIRSQERTIGLLSIGLIGGIFTLGKIFPAVNQAVLDFFGSLLGMPLSILVDPSDLIALPILYVGWRIWKNADPALDLRIARGWAALPLAALLTLGNAAMPDTGITCLLQQDNRLYTLPNRYIQDAFFSTDGGITWQEGKYQGIETCPEDETITFPQELVTRSEIRYRYAPEEDIQISLDDGKSWNTAFSIRPITEPQLELYNKKGFNGITKKGPLAAVEDANTGNIVFAMGWEGVLVHTTNEWVWVSVGEFQQLHPESPENLFSLLNLRLILAVAAAMMIILAASSYFEHGRWWKFGYILAWISWVSGVLVAIWDGQGYLQVITTITVFVGSLFIMVMGLGAIFRIIRHAPDAITPVAVTAFTALILFTIPYFFWALNLIPQYVLAMAISIILVLAVLLPSLVRFKKIIENANDEV